MSRLRWGIRCVGFVALVTIACAAWLLWMPKPVERTSGLFEQDVYVWQRRWDDSVLTAIDQHAGAFRRVVPLVTEVELSDGRPRVVEVPIDFAALVLEHRANGEAVQVGAALRIGPYPGPFAGDDAVGRQLCDAARSIVERAADQGVTLAELQIDFDAASSKLAGYRQWVVAIAEAVSPTPVVLTTLPTWMSHSGFGELVAAADAFVLQVHSIERPRSPDEDLTLCDVARTRVWVDQAARFGRPFRVALPTYGYLVAFDAAGEYLGLSADGDVPAWPADATVRRVDADPAAMASLIDAWAASRPMLMEGVIWYRLPVRTDTLNWRWPTLEAAMAGRMPVARAGVATRTVEPGLVEVDLTNTGDGDAPARQRVRLSWADSRFITGDGAMGYALRRDGDHAAWLQPQAAELELRRIGPGDTRTIGWLRFDRDTEVTVEIHDIE